MKALQIHQPVHSLIVYLAILGLFVALDVAWLVFVAADLFKRHAGAVLRDQPNLLAALAFYIIYAGGLLALAVRPAWQLGTRGSVATALGKGATLGVVAYATFDLTNLAIIKDWSLALALIDMAWGTSASALAAAGGYFVCTRLGGVETSRAG